MSGAARDTPVDTLRGIACILLVAYHVIGEEGRGLDTAPDSFLSWFSDSMAYLRMPLFTFLAGFVFAQRENTADRAGRFVWGKVRRLLFPLFCVGTLYYFVQAAAGQEPLQVEFFEIHIFPFEHFWYLQSLFIIFIFVFCLDVIGWIRTDRSLLAATAIALLVAPFIEFETNLFSINGAIYLVPYFLLGISFKRISWLSASNAPDSRGRIWLWAGVAVLTIVHQASLLWTLPELFHPYRLSGEVYSIACIALLYSLGLNGGFLSWVGGYSYSIYLFHIFGTAGARMLFGRVGVENDAVLFFLGMICGLLLPVVAEKVLERNPLSRMAFLGRSWSVKRPALVRD